MMAPPQGGHSPPHLQLIDSLVFIFLPGNVIPDRLLATSRTMPMPGVSEQGPGRSARGLASIVNPEDPYFNMTILRVSVKPGASMR